MYEIKIVEPCSCARKRKAWSKELVFQNFEEAKNTAEKMILQGNEKFCKRHSFSLKQNNNTLEIINELKK
jgi:hypothetical protein